MIEEPKILGLTGRQQSGKNTIGNFIVGVFLISAELVHKNFSITEEGKLWVSDIEGDESQSGILDQYHDDENMRAFFEYKVFPYVKQYSFADSLKQDVCINLLGLSWRQCYGTNDDKNTLTEIKFENLPGYVGEKRGYMTGREVLQYVGTDIFRKMYEPVWINATMNKILRERSNFSIITDARFPNEIDAVKNAGGLTIRLTRNWDKPATHKSELALDKDKYNWNNFNFILHNEEMTIHEQNMHVANILTELDWIPENVSAN